jgi:uncharacterized membrane protein
VILAVLGIAFGGHLALGGHPLMTVTTGMMLFSHLALALLSLRAEKKARGTTIS